MSVCTGVSDPANHTVRSLPLPWVAFCSPTASCGKKPERTCLARYRWFERRLDPSTAITTRLTASSLGISSHILNRVSFARAAWRATDGRMVIGQLSVLEEDRTVGLPRSLIVVRQ